MASVTISESAQDDLEITQHPVQDGAAITDHAYKKPVMLSVEAQYSDNLTGVPIDEMYRRLLTLQNTREPMDVVLRLCPMLIPLSLFLGLRRKITNTSATNLPGVS